MTQMIAPEDAKRRIATNVERYRERLGWSRYKLAQQSGVSEQTVANICNGRHNPRSHLLQCIAEALGVSIDALFAEEPAPKKSRRKNRKRA